MDILITKDYSTKATEATKTKKAKKARSFKKGQTLIVLRALGEELIAAKVAEDVGNLVSKKESLQTKESQNKLDN